MEVSLIQFSSWLLGFPGGSVVKNPSTNTGATGDAGSVPMLERSSGGENGNPLQYSCQGNPLDRGAWWVTVHGGHKELGVTERMHTHTHTHPLYLLRLMRTSCF